MTIADPGTRILLRPPPAPRRACYANTKRPLGSGTGGRVLRRFRSIPGSRLRHWREPGGRCFRQQRVRAAREPQRRTPSPHHSNRWWLRT